MDREQPSITIHGKGGVCVGGGGMVNTLTDIFNVYKSTTNKNVPMIGVHCEYQQLQRRYHAVWKSGKKGKGGCRGDEVTKH